MFIRSLARAVRIAVPVSFALASTTCHSKDENAYKPAAAYVGQRPNLPVPPAISSAPIKTGDSYTVHGAIHHLQSRIHEKEVNGKEISVIGYIVEENIATAPKCAVHRTGKKDPDGCTTEIPSFWIADEANGKGATERIRVLGWASNFSNVFEAMKKYGGRHGVNSAPKELYRDEFLTTEIPFPLPSVGAKIKLTALYGFTYRGGSSLVSDPNSGLLTYKKIEIIEPAPEPAAFAKR